MSSTGTSRSSLSGLSFPSAETDRIASRPLPIPGLGLATRSHLLRQLEIGRSAGAVWVVMGHRKPVAGRLAHPHVAGDHRVENQVRKVCPHFPLDIAPEPDRKSVV